ncbi:MAG: DEAD/DEAH box helicase [Alistipes sp.]
MTITDDFSTLGLSEQMLTAVKAKGFEVPTSIQILTIPRLLNQNNDIIAQSQTGTGKTAAYGLPILQLLTPSKEGVKAIILVPTRELAIQAADELNSYNQERHLSITAIYGGAAMSEQLRRLSKGVDIVVGTPGRVLDHIHRGTLRLEKVRFLVLDEADEMLNMGFVEDVEEIMSHTGEERRVMLFSATMPERIIRLSKTYMRDTELVKVESKRLTTELTEQIYFEVREGDKFDALTRIIDVAPDFYGIIFGRTKVGVDQIVTRLLEQGYAAEVLHGDVSQAQREKILKKFKSKAANILVATDVAARGIDVDCLTHVINYSLPQDSDSYVHRIGRTGRAGNQGTAITFISPSEFRKFNNLMRDIKVDIKKETLPSPQDIVAMKRQKIKEDMQEIINNETYSDYADVAQELLAENTPEVALSALLRLAFRNELTKTSYSEIRTFSVDRQGTTRLLLGIGIKDGYSAKKIVDMLKYKCGLRDKHIDDVKLFDSYTFVSVPFSEAEAIVRKLNNLSHGKAPMAEIAGEENGGAIQTDAPKRAYKRRDEGDSYGDAPKRAYKRRDEGTGYGDAPKRAYKRRDESASYGDAPKRAYKRRDESAGVVAGTEAPKRTYKHKEEGAGASDFSKAKAPNEGFDWSAFMKYDDGEKWGRDDAGARKATKSVRKTPKTAVTAAKRIGAKSFKK